MNVWAELHGLGHKRYWSALPKLTVNDFIINAVQQVSFPNEAVVKINRAAS